MEKFYKKLKALLASNNFFWAVIAFFVFESVWLVLTNKFPALFDEGYHFGIIQTYSHQWSPFFSHQPAGTSYLGPLTADPSFLFHYLLSFPYRIAAHFTSSVGAEIIILRFINVTFFTSGLIIFRKLFSYTKSSKAIINSVFLFVALTPVAPFLASQVNYDNQLVLLTASALLLTVKLVRRMEADGKINLALLAWLLLVCVGASNTVFNFLPIFLAIVIYVIYKAWHLKGKKAFSQYIKISAQSFKKYLVWQQVGLVLITLVSVGMLAKSYGYDIVKYHTPTPQCNQVLTFAECKAYAPWYRNYEFGLESKDTGLKLSKAAGFSTFTGEWWYLMANELSQAGSKGTAAPAAPVVTPWLMINFLAVLGIVLTIRYFREITRKPQLALFLLVIIFYFGALWLLNFKDYMHFGQPVAVQGRYAVILLPVMYLITAETIKLLLRRAKPILKVGAFLLVFLAMLNCGGAATYIIRSNSRVWWDNKLVIKANHGAQKVLNAVFVNFS